ncbi:MAG: hypothetical protein JOY61_25765 [Chloroflexi bacterium]|nr:hypothetical protein [Chloroflexota bacterium]
MLTRRLKLAVVPLALFATMLGPISATHAAPITELPVRSISPAPSEAGTARSLICFACETTKPTVTAAWSGETLTIAGENFTPGGAVEVDVLGDLDDLFLLSTTVDAAGTSPCASSRGCVNHAGSFVLSHDFTDLFSIGRLVCGQQLSVAATDDVELHATGVGIPADVTTTACTP